MKIIFEEYRDCTRYEFIKLRFKVIFRSGTYFAPIDLRWGINKNQSQEGRVISLCLDYIQNGAPYFICLLGESVLIIYQLVFLKSIGVFHIAFASG